MDDQARISPKAVAIGWLADAAGSISLALVAGFIASMSAISNGIRPDDVGSVVFQSPSLRLFSMVSGVFFVALGGYVAARIAGEGEVKNALAVGIVNLVLSVPFLLLGPFTGTTGFTLLSMLLMAPAAIAGGKLRALQVGS